MTVSALLAESDLADAALLLAHVLRRDRAWLVAHGDFEPGQDEIHAFAALCTRRHTGEPLAYITGSAWFYGREFLVNETVLVPRPETEHLIDEALAFIKAASPRACHPERVIPSVSSRAESRDEGRGTRGAHVLDVGTGSGAIACTIAAETGATVDATDISAQALDLARKNADRLGVAGRVHFYQGNLVEPVRNNRYDVVIANLPYIPTRDVPKPPDPVSFEPRTATDGGPDGLALYRRLLPALPAMIEDHGLVLLEGAPPTIEELAEIARAELPKFTVSVMADYAGLTRYVKARSI